MFGLFKKKNKTSIPAFEALEQSPLRDQYFGRCANWGWLDQKMIFVIDPVQLRMLTMDFWPQVVFLDANGQRTIRDYVYFMASRYSPEEGIPPELHLTILEAIEDHVNENQILELSDKPMQLPKEFLYPASTEDES